MLLLATTSSNPQGAARKWLDDAAEGRSQERASSARSTFRVEESESEDGATSYSYQYELYHNDTKIWSNSSSKTRGMSGMFGTEVTMELKESDGLVTFTYSTAPAAGGAGNTEKYVLKDGEMTVEVAL